MSFVEVYLVCAAGIALSVLIPVLSAAVKKQFNAGEAANVSAFGAFFIFLARAAKPYLILAAFSLATAILIVAFSGDALKTWQAALIAGYLWDSTLQKIVRS